jgi:signal transduction histidine kinase
VSSNDKVQVQQLKIHITSVFIFWSLFMAVQPVSFLSAQTYVANYNTLSYREGMSGQHPYKSLISSDGLLYALTEEALNCYNGYRFSTYPLPPSRTVGASRYELLEEDVNGLIWYGYLRRHSMNPALEFDVGIFILDPKDRSIVSFQERLGDSAPFDLSCITGISRKPGSQQLYFCTCDGRVYTYDEKGFSLLLETPEHAPIGSILPDSPQLYWIAEAKHLSLINEKGSYVKRLPLKASAAELSWLKSSLLQVTFDRKVNFKGQIINRLVLDQLEQKLSTYLPFPNGERVDISKLYSLQYDEGHKLWHFIDGKDWQARNLKGEVVFSLLNRFPELKDYYFPDHTFSLRRDNDGVLYACMLSRVLCLQVTPSPFHTLFSNQQLSLRDIAKGHGDTLWVSTYRGLYGYDQGEQREFLEQQSPDVPWLHSLKQSDSTFLVTGNRIFVLVYNEHGKKVDRIPISQVSKPPNTGLYLFKDERSQLWLGTHKGMYLYDSLQNVFAPCTQLNQSLDIEQASVRHITQHNGLIWATSEKGVFSFTPEGLPAPYQLKDSPKGFNGLYWQGKDSCWLASMGKGLLLWLPETGKTQWFTATDHGLSNDYLYGVYGDRQSRLWIPTNNGLTCFIPEQQKVEVFGEMAGLFGAEFNYLSHYMDTEGKLWLGGVNGLIYFQPDSIQIPKRVSTPLHCVYVGVPNIRTGLLDDRTEAFNTQRQIVLNPANGVNAFQIKLSLASYLGQQHHQYFWRAEGLTKRWQLMEGNSLTLADLPYGELELQFRARTRNRALSSEELSIPLIVLRPYYLKWWFWFLILSVLLLVIVTAVNWRTRQLKTEQHKLEQLVRERTHQIQMDQQTILQQKKELEYLNQGKDKVMSIIGHELRGSLFYLSSASQHLEKLLRQGDTATALKFTENIQNATLSVGDIVDNLSKWTAVRRGKLNLQKRPFELGALVDRAVRESRLFAEKKNINLQLKLQDPLLELHGDPNALLTVLLNLLRNAIKFTEQGGDIIISSKASEGVLFLNVEDSGTGIPEEKLQQLFKHDIVESEKGTAGEVGTGLGLHIAKEILQLHQADITVSSQEGEGSIFTIQFPVLRPI